VEDFYDDLFDLDLEGELHLPCCDTCGGDEGSGTPKWWTTFVNKVKKRGTKIRSTEWLFSPQLLADVKSTCVCHNCRSIMFSEEWFFEKLEQDIELLADDQEPEPGKIRGRSYCY